MPRKANAPCDQEHKKPYVEVGQWQRIQCYTHMFTYWTDLAPQQTIYCPRHPLYRPVYCVHGIDHLGCVECGHLQGEVTVVFCAHCKSGTWHTNQDQKCLKCGTKATIWRDFLKPRDIPPRWSWGLVDFVNTWKQIGLRGTLWVFTPRWLAEWIGNPCKHCGKGYFETHWQDYHEDCYLAFVKERTK